MAKWEQLILDDRYDNFETEAGRVAYEKRSYDLNRAESIRWAIARYEDTPEVANLLSAVRAAVQGALQVSADHERAQRMGIDTNSFLVTLGHLVEPSTAHTPTVKAQALAAVAALKRELNLDLSIAHFTAKRPEPR